MPSPFLSFFVLGFTLLSLLPQATRAQFDYTYYGCPGCEIDYYPWEFKCNEGGAAVGSWQCALCGEQYDTPETFTMCLANYTDFDYMPHGEICDAVGWTVMPDWTVTTAKLTPAIKPATAPNHITAGSGSTMSFSIPYSEDVPLVGFGRLFAFYYACSDGVNSVACNMSIKAELAVMPNGVMPNLNQSNIGYHPITATYSYEPASATAAPMKIGNFSPIAEENYKVRKETTVEKYALNYTFTAVKEDGCEATVHLDNLETSWWYPHGFGG